MAQQQESMFGPTPEEIYKALAQQEQEGMMKNAFAFGNQSLNQQLGTAGFMAGSNIAGGLGRLGQAFGVLPEDSRVAQARNQHEAVQDVRREGVDPNDPVAFYRSVAKKLADRGMLEQSLKLSMKATDTEIGLQKKRAEIGKLNAEALAKMREKESTIRTLRREFDAAMEDGRFGEAAQLREHIEKLNRDTLQKAQEGAGVDPATGRQMVRDVLIDPSNPDKPVWQGQPYVKQAGVEVNMGERTQSVFDEAGMEVDKKAAIDGAKALSERLGTANMMKGVTEGMEDVMRTFAASGDKGLTLGFGADMRGKLIAALDTFAPSLLSPEDKNTKRNNELFDSYVLSVVIPKMKLLGGNDSNQELETMKKTYAGRWMTPEAINALVALGRRDMERAFAAQNSFDEGRSRNWNPIFFNYDKGEWRVPKNPKPKGKNDFYDVPTSARPDLEGQQAPAAPPQQGMPATPPQQAPGIPPQAVPPGQRPVVVPPVTLEGLRRDPAAMSAFTDWFKASNELRKKNGQPPLTMPEALEMVNAAKAARNAAQQGNPNGQ
jgi:hypothetical protein